MNSLSQYIVQNCDKHLEELAALDSSLTKFISSDSTQGKTPQATKCYINNFRQSVIPAMRILLTTYAKEYKHYLHEYEGKEMGSGTKISEEELESIKKHLTKSINSFEKDINRTIKTQDNANDALDGSKISGAKGLSSINEIKNDANKYIDKTIKEVQEIEGNYNTAIETINSLITDLTTVLKDRKSKKFSIISPDAEKFWKTKSFKSMQERAAMLWLYSYSQKGKYSEDDKFSKYEFNEDQMLENLLQDEKNSEIFDIACKEIGAENGRKYREYVVGAPDDLDYCASFTTWVIHKAGIDIPLDGKKYKSKEHGPAYVPDLLNYTKEKGWYHKNNPKKGDLIFYDWNGTGDGDHVGIYEGINKDNNKYIVTIEANSDHGAAVDKLTDIREVGSDCIIGYATINRTPSSEETLFGLSADDSSEMKQELLNYK